MTTILAIETSGSACSVALARGGEIDQRVEAAPREHARKVLPMVDELLRQGNVPLEAVDAIAFTRGPGSFTGLRIGFGIVQGLAFGLDIPVIGVSTLQCMAFRAAKRHAATSVTVVPVLDARMGQVYWAAYRVEAGELPVAETVDSVMAPADACSRMPKNIDIAVGDGWPLIGDDSLVVGQCFPDFHADAESVAALALPLFRQGAAHNIFDAELSYIRDEVSWKKRKRIRTNPGA